MVQSQAAICRRAVRQTIRGLLLVAPLARVAFAGDQAAGLKAGDIIALGDRQATVTTLDCLPVVENEYSRRFKFDSYDNPKLKQLREHYKLDEVVSAGRDEFDRQVLLLDWVNRQFKKFGPPSAQPRGAAEILRDIDAGHTFFCAQYADVLISAAASLGWVDRSLALRRPDNMGQGSTEHSSTEIWSNQFRKWVMFDPTFAMYVERQGLPLNAYEVRQEWFYRDARDIVFVLGKDRQRYRRAEMPVVRRRFAGFGDLSLDPSAILVYAFIGYVPNTNLMDAGPDYGQMFITQDKLCEGTQWHKRVGPANPADDPYFPIGQAAVTLTAERDRLSVGLKTLTPNFKSYTVRIDDGEWRPSGATVAWQLHAGTNRLQARTVNQFEVQGPTSTVEVEIKAQP
jgi:hypothetical protein